MSEWKKCGGCGAKYNGEACNYCTVVVEDIDQLPQGILCLSNISRREWESALKEYRARADSDVPFKDKCVVLFGIDPSIETKVTYLSISHPGKKACEFEQAVTESAANLIGRICHK